MNRYLQHAGMQVATGTLVDATIIPASASTKNAKKPRDPERHQTKKAVNGIWAGRRSLVSSAHRSGFIAGWPPLPMGMTVKG